MANDWKEAHFERTLKKTSGEDVEEEYWRIVYNPEKQVAVEYGSELHTTQVYMCMHACMSVCIYLLNMALSFMPRTQVCACV